MTYGELHEKVKTTITSLDFIEAIIIAWKTKFNEEISENSAYIICAKYSLETGFGKSCWNFNIGNIKKAINDSHQDGYFQLPGTWEIINGKKVIFEPFLIVNLFGNYRIFDSCMDFLRKHATSYTVSQYLISIKSHFIFFELLHPLTTVIIL